tara:strand:- start:285 stop:629 length:345 start_codon:yes stop_codon:yes gene_type:complete
MSLPYDVKVLQACQRLNSKIVTCSGIKSDNITDLITTDESGTEISLDKTKLEAEIKKIQGELDALKYQDDRRRAYPNIGDFADAMYWNSKGDSSKLTAYYAACEKVKTDNPKPS